MSTGERTRRPRDLLLARRVAQALLLLQLARPAVVDASATTEPEEPERDASDSLRRRLDETMASQTVKYTPLVETVRQPYKASTKFNPKGMGQLYNVTNMFMDLVQSKQAYPQGMIRLERGSLVLADPATEWRLILTHYGGLTGLALAGLLLAAVLPCVGLFFCCCRCAGRCGARSEPFDKKHDHCRKIVLSLLLMGFATILLFGVVCAFVTNEYMQDGTRELPNSAKTSLGDVRLYLDTTRGQTETLLKVNYDELELVLNGILGASGKIVMEQLAESSHAVSLVSLNDLVAGLGSIRRDLKMMNDITMELRNNASNLEILVRRVRGQLLQTFVNCNTQDCKDVMHKYKISEMSVKVDFDKLPDIAVSPVLNNISYLMEEDIVADVRTGMEQFMNIQKEIQQAVNDTSPS